MFVLILGTTFPILGRTPTKRKKLIKKFASNAEEISTELLRKTRIEKEGNVAEAMSDHSVIGLLSADFVSILTSRKECLLGMAVKAESDDKVELRISEEEVMAQASAVFPSSTSAY